MCICLSGYAPNKIHHFINEGLSATSGIVLPGVGREERCKKVVVSSLDMLQDLRWLRSTNSTCEEGTESLRGPSKHVRCAYPPRNDVHLLKDLLAV